MAASNWLLLTTALLLAGRAEAKPPRCREAIELYQKGVIKAPYPCDAGSRHFFSVGPYGGYQAGPGLSRAHVGGEVSLLFGKLTDDGAHTNFRSHVFGPLLDLGWLSNPNAFRVAVEGQWSYPLGGLIPAGISAGPYLTVNAAEACGGASVTVWVNVLVIVYGRFGSDFQWRPYGEVGAMIKIPVPLSAVF